MSKIDGIFLIFFSFKNIKKEDLLLFLKYLYNFHFKCTLFSKSVPNFWPSKPKRTNHLKLFYTHQVGAEAKLIHPCYVQLFKWGHAKPSVQFLQQWVKKVRFCLKINISFEGNCFVLVIGIITGAKNLTFKVNFQSSQYCSEK